MGNVERVDKTLPANEMVYYVRKDAALRERWKTDLEGICNDFRLSQEEYVALREMNPKVLLDMGVHQYLIPHLLRLTYGETNMTNNHPALTAYQKVFPKESKDAIGNSKWDISGGDSNG